MTPRSAGAALLREGFSVQYTSGEVADMFGKTRQWLNFYLRRGEWVDKDGTPLTPRRISKTHLWSADDVRCVAAVCFKRNSIDLDQFKAIIKRILRDESKLTGKYPTKEPEQCQTR